MSVERNKPPTMSTAIMYHHEAQLPAYNPFSRQPDAAFVGLNKIIPEQCFKSTNYFSDDKNSKLNTQPRGHTHTGAHMVVNYQISKRDPNWSRPVYGNLKPQILTYSMSRSNLLSKY